MGGPTDRLSAAIQVLIGEGPLRERLKEAAMTLMVVRLEEFPDSDDARVFARILREVGFYDDGDISTVVGQLSDEDARRIAIEILGLFCRRDLRGAPARVQVAIEIGV